jgi:hypothetical protein
MKEFVASGAGYLQGGLQRENWERATLSIVKMTSQVTIHPGLNFFIKHVGSIFRNLFQVALQDMKLRSVDTNRLLEICPGLENRLAGQFDDMLWKLMQNAADKTHLSMEPWYSCLDPTLPGYHPANEDNDGDFYEFKDGEYVKTPSKGQHREQMNKENGGLVARILSLFETSVDEKKAKELLRERGRQQAELKRNFLPEERTSMINDDETEKIILSAFRYVVALQEQIQTYLNFQINHYLYNEFKTKLAVFPRLVSNDDWKEMIPDDTTMDDSIQELKNKIAEIKGSLGDVQRMQAQF